jgi:hypothetical protein
MTPDTDFITEQASKDARSILSKLSMGFIVRVTLSVIAKAQGEIECYRYRWN